MTSPSWKARLEGIKKAQEILRQKEKKERAQKRAEEKLQKKAQREERLGKLLDKILKEEEALGNIPLPRKRRRTKTKRMRQIPGSNKEVKLPISARETWDLPTPALPTLSELDGDEEAGVQVRGDLDLVNLNPEESGLVISLNPWESDTYNELQRFWREQKKIRQGHRVWVPLPARTLILLAFHYYIALRKKLYSI